MNKFMKCVSLVLCLALLLCGCPSASTENGETEKITVVLMDKGRCSAEEGDMTSNRWTRYINENSGVIVEFIAVARDNFEENLNYLVASGVIPDIMLTYEDTYVQQLIDQELIQPIGELIDEYSTTCKQYLHDHPELVNYLTFHGELYAMTNLRETIVDQGAWIRQDWLDQMGMDMPTTVDEFLDVCRAFKEAKLGGTDTVPISLMHYYWGYFAPLYSSEDLWYVNEDGKVEYGVLTDRFAASTTLLKTCYDEGLISKEFAADSDSSLATQSWVSGKSGVLLYKSSPALIQELLENDPTANPVPMPPFETEYGINAFHQSKLSNAFVMISSQAKYPELVIKYLDWMLEDGWFPLTYGLENVHYTMDDNGYPVAIQGDEVYEQMRYSSAYVLLSQNEVTKESILASAAKDEMSQAIARLEATSMELNASYTFRRDFPYDPDVSEYGILYADWSMIEQQLMVKAIIGGSDYSINDMMQDLRTEWNALGGETVEKKVQEWYNNNSF